MGNVRKYEPDDVKLSDFTFKLLAVEQVDTNKNKPFTEKYKIKVPTNVRSRYSADVVFGQEWCDLLSDFDKKLLGCHPYWVSSLVQDESQSDMN